MPKKVQQKQRSTTAGRGEKILIINNSISPGRTADNTPDHNI